MSIPNKATSDFELKNYAHKLKIPQFQGVFMRDQLPHKMKDGGYIINLDKSSGDGTHWTGLVKRKGVYYYFDSYGFPPPQEVIDRICQQPDQDGINDNIRVLHISDNNVQDRNSNECGMFALWFIMMMLRNKVDFRELQDFFNNKNEGGRKFNRKLLQNFFINI